jgi:hypothetical protein
VDYPKLAQFSQVKTSAFAQHNVTRLFSRFKLYQLLRDTGISKEKGHSPLDMLFIMLLLILENSRSVFSGISRLGKASLKTPLNSMLNNENYNWRHLLYKVAKVYARLCPVQEGNIPVLIIDDTAKVKTGRKGEHTAWFINHCKQEYYKGFQVVMSVWSNGAASIPIDAEIKIGKSKIKHAARSHYLRGTHIAQRERMGKQKKLTIAMQFIRRALQRRFDFRYVLWDSWYNCSESLRLVYEVLHPKGIHLISILKRDKQKYLLSGEYLTVNEIYCQSGNWYIQPETEIKFKSAVVTVLDKQGQEKPRDRAPLGQVKMCFFKYAGQQDFKVIISTNVELSEIEILSLYLRRWSVEVVFRDLKQYFGFDRSKSSKYCPQVADLTIRCIFYIMFCSMRYSQPEKTTDQLLFEFYNEMQDYCLDILCMLVFQKQAKCFLYYAMQQGLESISDLMIVYDDLVLRFLDEQWFEDKIEESDNIDFSRFPYRKAG